MGGRKLSERVVGVATKNRMHELLERRVFLVSDSFDGVIRFCGGVSGIIGGEWRGGYRWSAPAEVRRDSSRSVRYL